MKINAGLYNADRLEYSFVIRPFPIPSDPYDSTINMLEMWEDGMGTEGSSNMNFFHNPQ